MILYKHIRLDNNEVFYIGIGKTIKRAYSKKNRNKHWNNIVNKCDYIVEIIDNYNSWEECCLAEKEYIKKYGRRDLKSGTLVNLTDGGQGRLGYKWTDIQKENLSKKNIGKKHNSISIKKISDSLKGNKYSLGNIVSLENRKRMSDRNKGSGNPRYGVKLTDDIKKKISDALKGVRKKIIICDYCGKSGGISNMKRYHMNNCKLK